MAATVNIGAMTTDQKTAAAAAVAAANQSSGLSAKAAQQAKDGGINADFNFFLKMLTTQLTNQDPTAPMDTAAMTQQIATFSGVEQQVQTNSKLDKLLTSNSSTVQQSQLTGAANFIGREIETAGSTGQVYGGQGAFSYLLPKAANSVEVTIKNSSGTTVFAGKGSTTAGRNTLLWDGVNSSTNQQEPDGVYTISVSALDGEKKAIVPENRAVWYVSGFEKDAQGNILLNVANQTVKYDDVLTVRPATRADLTNGATAENGGDTTSGGTT